MRLRKSLIGQPFRCVFWDHSENYGHAVRSEAYGKLRRYDRSTIILRAWDAPDDPGDSCITDYAILRKVITTLERLVIAK